MIIHQHVSKAKQDDARLAGERNRLILEARRAGTPRPKRLVLAASAGKLARLLLRRAPATGDARKVLVHERYESDPAL